MIQRRGITKPYAGLSGDVAHESELVVRARVDRAAFAELYRAHVESIGRYLKRLTGDDHEAEDLVAEVFIRAMRALDRFEPRGVPLRHWLLRIATNLALRRSPRRRPASLPDECAAPSRDETGDGRRQRVRDGLRQLPPRYAEALTLHHIEGLSVAEVAAVLGIGGSAVKSRLVRGRERLRAILEREE